MTNPSHPLDRYERDILFSFLGANNDTSFAATAEQQLITPNGEVDRTVLRYLEDSLKEQAIPAIARALKNPAITNASKKEPLLGVIVEQTGKSTAANQVLQELLLDQTTPVKLRERAIRELDNEGFEEDNPSAEDLKVVASRLALLEQLTPTINDPNVAQHAQRIGGNLAQILSKSIGPDGQVRPRRERGAN
jgi:uncharacterized protein (UPF0147 family)